MANILPKVSLPDPAFIRQGDQMISNVSFVFVAGLVRRGGHFPAPGGRCAGLLGGGCVG